MGAVKWTFEPGHTEAEFKAKHMMVTWVTGLFKDIHGTLEFDPNQPKTLSFEAEIDAAKIWTGVPERDAHLRTADFLDVEKFPKITYKSTSVEQIGETEYTAQGNLTIRGVTKPAALDIRYLGQWQTPWWEGGVNKGPKLRAGFIAKGRINRHDFGVSWNDTMPNDGIVVSHEVFITINVEAVLDDAIEKQGEPFQQTSDAA